MEKGNNLRRGLNISLEWYGTEIALLVLADSLYLIVDKGHTSLFLLDLSVAIDMVDFFIYKLIRNYKGL